MRSRWLRGGVGEGAHWNVCLQRTLNGCERAWRRQSARPGQEAFAIVLAARGVLVCTASPCAAVRMSTNRASGSKSSDRRKEEILSRPCSINFLWQQIFLMAQCKECHRLERSSPAAATHEVASAPSTCKFWLVDKTLNHGGITGSASRCSALVGAGARRPPPRPR
jgi:hypothetical protein